MLVATLVVVKCIFLQTNLVGENKTELPSSAFLNSRLKMTHTLTVKTSTNDFTLTGRPCEMSGYSFIPPLTQIPRGRKFYNNTRIIREKTESFIYDDIHHQNKELDVKAHRDDRQFSNFKGLRVKEEEVSKPVPSRTSSIYGHRMMRYGQIEPTDRTHVRMSKVNTEFFRRNGVNIK